jgi:flavin reductase (DIM6/NTAB) family NADH-FMN oxidoreductase RutF
VTPRGDEGPFADAVGDLEYPMIVVTAAAGGRRAGCLVGFAAQCSISPPRFMVWLSHRNHTLAVARGTDRLGVHLLSADDRPLAELFGSHCGEEVDKFASLRWHEGAGGVPLLDDCPRWFVGRVLERFDAGDHDGFLLEPVEAGAGPWSGQLGFQQVRDLVPGHDA